MQDHHDGMGGVVSAQTLAFIRAHRATPTLSVYANRDPEDLPGRRALRLELNHALDAAYHHMAGASKHTRQAFARCEERIRTAQSGLSESTPAAAMFVTINGEVLIEPLAMPIETTAEWRDGLRIGPLLGAVSPPQAIVALVDSEHGALFRLTRDALTPIESHVHHTEVELTPHMGSLPRTGFHGGTRGETQTDAAERIRHEAHVRHAHKVAQRVSALAGDSTEVVLGGSAPTVALVLDSLSAPARRHAIATQELRVKSTGPDIARIARAAQHALAAQRHAALLGDLLNHARHAHHSAIGIAEVADAATARAVDHLLVSRTLLRAGPAGLDRTIEAVFLDGGAVEIVHDTAGVPLLSSAQGIAARLRFTPRTAPAKETRVVQ